MTVFDKCKRSTFWSAGYDIVAPRELKLGPGHTETVDLGICLTDEEITALENSIPNGRDVNLRICFKVIPRSGLGSKYGLRLLNTEGLIDQDYKENWIAKVTADVPCTIACGERFLQFTIETAYRYPDEIEPTKSRDGGHGSTGRF